MADETRIGTARSLGGLDRIKQNLGLGAPAGERTAVAAAPVVERGGIGGPRGQRMLPPDYPLDALDRTAPRGTYLDILV